MLITLVQPDVVWERREANFDRVRALLASKAPAAGGLIVLPEMFSAGFTMNVAAMAEKEPGPTEAFMQELARRYASCVLGGLIHLAGDGRGLNVALAIGADGQRLACYEKIHPFSYAGEEKVYAAGRTIVRFDWAGMSVSPFICYDLRFPEVYRIATARGAEVLVTIANFPSARVHHWESLLVARAIENQAYVVGVNRCGADPNVDYPGRSLVIDPLGEVIVDAGPDEGVVSAELSADRLRSYRARFPALQDMRDDFLRLG